MSPDEAQPVTEHGTGRPGGPLPGDEAVFEVLGEFQSGVEALKSLYAQRTALKAKLEQEEAEVRRKTGLLVEGQRAIMDLRQRVELRRQRLLRMRELVKRETGKLRSASEALHGRIKQCEQLMAQRIELVQAREAIEAAGRRVERSKSRSRTAATMLCWVSTAAVLLLASWLVAGSVRPGTFVATAVLVADGHGRDLTAPDRAGWQSYHEQLLTDPQFHEMGAERMLRRGIITLGTPGSFAEMMTRNLTAMSATDGELTLELREQGGDRTARILDTVVTALASYANAAAQRRSDGAATEIKQPAKPGASPIDRQREIMTAEIWLGATALVTVLSLVVWRKMVRDKATFEALSRASDLLDESRWVHPGGVS